MFPAQSTTSLTMVLTLAIFILSSISCSLAEDSAEFYNDLSPPSDNSPGNDLSKNTRLRDLLRLQASFSDFLPQNQDSNQDNHSQLDGSGVSKRVFCNHFTGCGGRFRGRRRQQQPVTAIGKTLKMEKRPFCNTYGCYNWSKKRNAGALSGLKSNGLDQNKATAFAEGLSGVLCDPIRGCDGNMAKRIFCNPMSGCRGILAKRMALLQAQLSKGSVHELPFSRSQLEKVTNGKRFFSSGFDNDMDSLIDTMKR